MLPDGRVGFINLGIVGVFNSAPAARPTTGNLLVLPDGRVGFIDFGIVGRVLPVTWGILDNNAPCCAPPQATCWCCRTAAWASSTSASS